MSDTDAWGGAEHLPSSQRVYDETRKQHTVNFESSTLIDANFDNAGMGGASLVKSCLAGASFDSTDLSRALFQGADMGRGGKCASGRNLAYFYRVVFIDANFDDVDIGGVSFVGSNLTRTNFSKAKNVDKAAFDRVCADEPPKFPPPFTVAFWACAR